MTSQFNIRVGAPADAPEIAALILAAGSGVFEQLLEGVVPGLPVDSLLALAIHDDTSPYHFENALIAEADGLVAGMVLGFPAEDFRLPQVALDVIPDARLAPLRAMLSWHGDDSFYVNSLAVLPDYARQGLGRLLLAAAAAVAAGEGFDRVSLHVWADNEPAVSLYRSLGFEFRPGLTIAPTPRLRQQGPVILAQAPVERLLADVH